MAPAPKELSTCQKGTETGAADGDRVVISGMSGLYPASLNVKEFSELLYNKVNPVTSNLHYRYNHPEITQFGGTISTLQTFDAQFFKFNYLLGNYMEPKSRKLLEQAYQAIYDAGVSPEQLSGKRVGVFVGACFSEAEKNSCYSSTSKKGLGLLGGSKAMYANRISYWLNAKGPSMCIDEDCCSSTTAIEQAYLAMSRGECEAAVVGGSFLCLHPQSAVHLGRIIKICPDGKTKSFAENADGCAISEAINVLFLQKAKDALRIHAEVLYAKTEFIGLEEDNKSPKYGFYRQPNSMANYMKTFYEEARLPPQAVEYVEAHGSAVPEADRAELEAIDEVFCSNRNQPLLIGSVMSNIGYCEAASGIAAITKVLLGYHNGVIPANLHCDQPRQDVSALREGRIRVVTEHQPFDRSYVAVNGMSVTGVNSHVLLHGRYKPKDLSMYKCSMPYLVTLSSRTDEMVQNVIDNLKSRPVDPEEIALLRNIHKTNITGHLGRGFVILNLTEDQKTESLKEKVEYFDSARRPLWFVYSGMGSQWAGMGAQLMRIPIFAAAIERCRLALEPKGLDIVHIITCTDKDIFDNIMHSFVGIAAIQIGLTDILREVGMVPDGIIGHSVGELGCAYADGCLTAEEMILSAYSRGLVSLQTPFIRGSMAAVGLGYEKIVGMCPDEIQVACHNGPESCTISGPADDMKLFVDELKAKGIFAKEVPCSNIAYHSRYIADAGPGLLEYLSEVIKEPRPRSDRWLSTSVPRENWDSPHAKYSSAEYHTNNLLNPVLFEETSRLIPSNAVLVEVAPHGLLQAILKRSLPTTCSNIALTRRGHADNVVLVLEAIGKLYTDGYNPNVQELYPKIEFPVSTETPLLSHLVEWMHAESWALSNYSSALKNTAPICKHVISLYDEENKYLRGNVIRGQTLYPFSAALVAAWDTLAMSVGVPRKQLSVVFEDVKLLSQPILHERTQMRLTVSVQRGNGYFEISNENVKVATGFIEPLEKSKAQPKRTTLNDELDLTSEDIYRLLEDRNYYYSGEFRSIVRAGSSLKKAEIVWQNNWATLLDGLLQLNALRQAHNGVSTPTNIRHISIDIEHNDLKNTAKCDGDVLFDIDISENHDMTRCAGVVIENVKYFNAPAATDADVEANSLHFTPHCHFNTNGQTGGQYNITRKMYELNNSKRNVALRCGQICDFDSLSWVEAPEPVIDGLTVTVHFAGINCSDIKKVSGTYLFKEVMDNNYGMDFSGLTNNGQRVMGIVPSGACARRVRAIPQLMWPVPRHWSLEDAATVPLAYAYAFYCLGVKGQLRPGMTVFVHGGAGALGQAVITVALAIGCEVFTTVSDVRKKQFLLKLFPTLKADHIGNSRDETFADMVLSFGKNSGCDFVINTGTKHLKDVLLKCCSNYAMYYDVTQLQDHDSYNFGMANLNKEVNYFAVDFSSIFMKNNYEEMQAIQIMVSEGIARGYVRPITRVVYEPSDITRAFRLLAASQHRGRVLLRMTDHISTVAPRLTCDSNLSQVILCDDNFVCSQLIDKLLDCGARKLFVHCDPKLTNLLRVKKRLWEKRGARVDIDISTNDLKTEEDISTMLTSATSVGAIEGMYITLNNAKRNNEDLYASLDIISRKLCPNLRNFVVVHEQNDTGKYTCLSRAESKLPATFLSISGPKDQQSPYSIVQWRRSVAEAVQHAARYKSGVYHAQHVDLPSGGLIQKIAQITGINISETTPVTATLEELGIEEHTLKIIANLLKIELDVTFTEEEIKNLTIDSINHIENTEIREEDVRGLGNFFSYVDADELLATTDIVFLPTLVGKACMRDDEMDTSVRYLCVVPGLEGHHERFRVLCERLKLPAAVLQPALDAPHETTRDLARRYAEILLNKIELKDNFYLLGYESGVWIAMEIASILEERGMTGTVFCLGFLQEFKDELERHLSEFKTVDQLQDALVRHMFKLMVNDDTVELETALLTATTWEEKVDVTVRNLLGRVPHSAQYARSLIEAAFARLEQARRYSWSAKPLRSKIVLLRASTTASHDEQALQSYSQQPVTSYQLSSPLALTTADMQCAALINKHLDPEILEAFNNANTCDVYVLNPDSYVLRAM